MTETSKVTERTHRDDARLEKDALALLKLIRGRTKDGTAFDFTAETAAFAIEAFYKCGQADSAFADAARAFLEPYKELSDEQIKEANIDWIAPHVKVSVLAFRKIIEQVGGKS